MLDEEEMETEGEVEGKKGKGIWECGKEGVSE